MAGSTPKSRASDFTGRQRDQAAKSNAEEQKRRADEMSMATQAEQEIIETTVTDLTDPRSPSQVEITEVEVNEQEVTIKVNEDIDMTYAGVAYNMVVGRTYKVPKHIADWLEERHVVWH